MAACTGGPAPAEAGGQAPISDASWLVNPDEAFQAELFQTFVAVAPEQLANIRNSLEEFWRVRSADPLPHMMELHSQVHTLAGSAGIAGQRHLSAMAAALERLLQDLCDKPQRLQGSTVRTMADAIDLLGTLFQAALDPGWQAPAAIRILLVDDDAHSRRAVLHALGLVALKAVSVPCPSQALELVRETVCDLILLDAQLSEMNGFELCARIRTEPKNRLTPVIFVSAMTDFTSRARLTLSGGADLVGKPFLFSELGLKALTYVWRGHVAKPCPLPCSRAAFPLRRVPDSRRA